LSLGNALGYVRGSWKAATRRRSIARFH
jgi:hypothetical protein